MAREKILVVDDEKSLCDLYEIVLGEEGYDVRVAGNAAAALSALPEFDPDLVVMDIRMPGMDGIETMGRMLAERNDLPVIINTAYSAYKDNFCTWPASAYVLKSSDTTELVLTVRRELDRGKASRAKTTRIAVSTKPPVPV
jgi:DNA-binding response OmpR family regulator